MTAAPMAQMHPSAARRQTAQPMAAARSPAAITPHEGPGMSGAQQSLRLWSEEELALGAAAGSHECFTALAERLSPRVYSFLVKRTGCAHDSEDLLQETLARAWEKRRSYRPGSSAATWTLSIAARLSIDLHRAKQRRASRESVLAAETPRQMAHTGPAAAAHTRESNGLLWDLADRTLSVEQRSALWLRYVEGLSIAHISRVLGRTSVWTRVTLFRARAALAAALKPHEDDDPGSHAKMMELES